MSVGERDPHSGHMTTGHDWNGIKELNRPVPKIIWLFLAATVIFSVVYWILMPAWPLGVTYTHGLLGIDQRDSLEAQLEEGAQQQSAWADQIREASFGTIQEDPQLMETVRKTGATLFGDNCAVCHGTEGNGGPGYPNLSNQAWLWGGAPEEVQETLRVGINADHPETRISEMMAFGENRMLGRDEIRDVVTYVQSLSNPDAVADRPEEALANGEEIFAANCVSCHAEDGSGMTELGAPDLTDDSWIYGGDRQSLYDSIYHGRQGVMPHWEGRLSPLERKMLALYVVDMSNRDE